MIASTGMRKIDRWTKGGWQRCAFRMLQPGDVFRMFNPDGKQVVNADGATIFKATCSPGPTKDRMWGIRADSVHDEPGIELEVRQIS